MAILDKEAIAHDLLQTKIETNNLARDNVQLRTQNKNMQTLVDTLYDDLDTYQEQVQRMYQGQALTQQILQGSIVQGVKRQVRDERLLNKQLQNENDKLKRSVKATKIKEMETIVEEYSKECMRLRKLLEIQDGQIPAQGAVVFNTASSNASMRGLGATSNSLSKNHMRILDLMSNENRNQLQDAFEQLQVEVQLMKEQNKQLLRENENLHHVNRERSKSG